MARYPTLLTPCLNADGRLLRQALRLLSSEPAMAPPAPLSLRGIGPLPLHQSLNLFLRCDTTPMSLSTESQAISFRLPEGCQKPCFCLPLAAFSCFSLLVLNN